jgi:AcrR family transcriptional regulator
MAGRRAIIGDYAPYSTGDSAPFVNPRSEKFLTQRPMRADARRNHDRLIEVATAAFATEGVSVSLDEIARRAAVGPGTLYRNFPTKESLIEAVVHHRLQQLVDDARVLRDSPEPGVALLEFVDYLVTEVAAKRDLVDELRSEIGHLLRRGQRSGAVRTDIGTAELMALMSGVIVALGPQLGEPPDPRAVLAVLHDGLRSRPSNRRSLSRAEKTESPQPSAGR